MENSGVVQTPISFWLEDFLLWLPNNAKALNLTLNTKGRPMNQKDFYTFLYAFLADPSQNGGIKYYPDIVFQFGKLVSVAQ